MWPQKLEHWTLTSIGELLDAGLAENDKFDFKGDLQPAEHQRRTVAAFANSGGGFIVYGVSDDRRVLGVARTELPRDFANKLRAGIEPSAVAYEFAPPIAVGDDRSVFVVEVQPYTRGPIAVQTSDGCLFFKRTAGGTNVPMAYEEIRRRFMDADRKARERSMLEHEVRRLRDQAEQMNATLHHQGWNLMLLLTRFDPADLRAMLASFYASGDGNADVIARVQTLMDFCGKVHVVLEQLARVTLTPRGALESYGFDDDLHGFVHSLLPQIVFAATGALAALNR